MNAYLTLLKLKKNEGDTHIFVMPSYVAVLWDNNNLDHYMFKRVSIHHYAWKIMCLLKAQISGEQLQNHWFSGLIYTHYQV